MKLFLQDKHARTKSYVTSKKAQISNINRLLFITFYVVNKKYKFLLRLTFSIKYAQLYSQSTGM